MKKHITYLSTFVITIASITLTACHNTTASTTQASTQAPIPTSTLVLKANTDETILKIPAEIVADKSADIYAKVLSYVTNLRVDIGSRVNKGDVLLELEAPELEAQLASLKASISALAAQVTLSTSNHNRLVAASKAEGSVSQFAIEEALAQLEREKAQLESAKANYEQVKSMTNYLIVHAPFSGIITQRNVDLGNMVGPTSGGQQQPLFILQDDQQLRLRLSISEQYVPQIKLSDSAHFTVRSLPSHTFSAKLTRTAGALDNRLRSQTVEFDYTNHHQLLMPGMVADVSLKPHRTNATFWVPKIAVISSPNGKSVTLIKNDTTTSLSIKIIQERGMQVEIAGSLNEGDTLQIKNMM
ncbi:MAG: efflux RND transporter periplasmic adaptor subunit [Bacteroidales bacterium]